ncbi:hypothetical protein ACFQX7_32070 [Luedemannella flava]
MKSDDGAMRAVFVPADVRAGQTYVDDIPIKVSEKLAAYMTSGRPVALMECAQGASTATYTFRSDTGGGRRVDLVTGKTLD